MGTIQRETRKKKKARSLPVKLTSEEWAATAASLNVMDDAMFHKVAEDAGAVEDILRVVLEDGGLRVEEVQPQRFLRNCGSRSVVLDALCKLSDGRLVNVEVQTGEDIDHFKRVRYNLSNADTAMVEKGCEFHDLPDTVAVYLTPFDVFKAGLPIYRVRRRVDETGEAVPDGTLCIYANAAHDDGSLIARLMGYLVHSTGYDQAFPRLCKRVQLFKEPHERTVPVNKVFNEIMERHRDEWEDIYRQEARENLKEELRDEVIAEVTEEVTNEITGRITEEVTERVTNEVTGRVTEEVTERVTEEVTERVTEEITGRVSRNAFHQVVRNMLNAGCDESLILEIVPDFTLEEIRSLKAQPQPA